MAISPFQRLISNTDTVFLGSSRDEAAMNAANNTGDHPDAVARRIDSPTWPSLQKFDNDTSAQPFSPYGSVPNPEYIWDQPTSDGQMVAFAIASEQFTVAAGLTASFSVSLEAFADDGMEAKIELFEEIGGTFVKVSPQPEGLDEFLLIAGEPNNPAVGLTINDPPYTFQDIRMYSTSFTTSLTLPSVPRTFKIVVSFEVTNYLQQPIYSSNPSSLNNPAGLQFVIDIYSTPGSPVNNGYFSFIATGTAQSVTTGNPFTFNTVTANGPMTLTSSNTINVNATGTYVISYGVTTNNSTGKTIALRRNATTASDTPINIASVSGSQQMISATIIKNLVSSDTIQLITAGATTVTTHNFNLVAYVTIFQIA